MGAYPYNQLRIIDEKCKDYHNALHVCEAGWRATKHCPEPDQKQFATAIQRL